MRKAPGKSIQIQFTFSFDPLSKSCILFSKPYATPYFPLYCYILGYPIFKLVGWIMCRRLICYTVMCLRNIPFLKIVQKSKIKMNACVKERHLTDECKWKHVEKTKIHRYKERKRYETQWHYGMKVIISFILYSPLDPECILFKIRVKSLLLSNNKTQNSIEMILFLAYLIEESKIIALMLRKFFND